MFESTLQCSQQFLHANGVKCHQFKSRDSKIKPYSVCLKNISKNLYTNNMKKTGLKRYVYDFSVSYDNMLVVILKRPTII